MKTVLLLLASLIAATAAYPYYDECEAPGEVFCKPDQRFDLECNKCICNSDGITFRCTDKKCPPRDHFLLKYEHGPGDNCRVSKICLPGSTKYENGNPCTCDPDGKSYTCRAEKFRPEEQSCSPGSKKKEFCNDCICNQDGQSYACTNDYCNPDLYNEDGSLKYGRCRPNLLTYTYTSAGGECELCGCIDTAGLQSKCIPVPCKREFSIFADKNGEGKVTY